jgi:hypothetical protein
MSHTTLANTASRLIEKHGRSVVLVTKGSASPDPTKPWRTSAAEVESTIRGVMVDPSDGSFGYITPAESAQLIARGSKVFLVAAKSIDDTLPPEDLLRIKDDDNSSWRILSAELLRPGNVKILWKLEVQR